MGKQIAILAKDQLAKWQAFAMTEATKLRPDRNEMGDLLKIHRDCLRCGQAIITEWTRPAGTEPAGSGGYLLTLDTILSLIVAHLRQNHMELEPEVYGDE